MTTSPNDTTNTEDLEHTAKVDELQADIERTREDLAETVDALTAKLDLKSRAKQRMVDAKQRAAVQLDTAKGRTRALTARARNNATDAQGKPTPIVLVGTGVAAALVALGVLLWSRSRR
jgi:chromosome segregation ATPase